jgi:hypothetical protein
MNVLSICLTNVPSSNLSTRSHPSEVENCKCKRAFCVHTKSGKFFNSADKFVYDFEFNQSRLNNIKFCDYNFASCEMNKFTYKFTSYSGPTREVRQKYELVY